MAKINKLQERTKLNYETSKSSIKIYQVISYIHIFVLITQSQGKQL